MAYAASRLYIKSSPQPGKPPKPTPYLDGRVPKSNPICSGIAGTRSDREICRYDSKHEKSHRSKLCPLPTTMERNGSPKAEYLLMGTRHGWLQCHRAGSPFPRMNTPGLRTGQPLSPLRVCLDSSYAKIQPNLVSHLPDELLPCGSDRLR